MKVGTRESDLFSSSSSKKGKAEIGLLKKNCCHKINYSSFFKYEKFKSLIKLYGVSNLQESYFIIIETFYYV